MGAINQAFNQGLGSVAAAATLIRGEKEKAISKKEQEISKKEQDISQALLGKEQYHESEAEIKDLTDQLTGAKNKWGEAEADLAILGAKRPGGKGNTKAAIDEKKKAKMNDIEAAKRSFEELTDKIAAKRAMKQRAELMIKKADKWGGIK